MNIMTKVVNQGLYNYKSGIVNIYLICTFEHHRHSTLGKVSMIKTTFQKYCHSVICPVDDNPRKTQIHGAERKQDITHHSFGPSTT